MITVQQIKKEIESYRWEIRDSKRINPDKSIKRLETRIKALQQCCYYLETNPNPVLIKSELEKIQARLLIIENQDNFETWRDNNVESQQTKNPKALYLKQMQSSKIKSQIKTLKYLIG